MENVRTIKLAHMSIWCSCHVHDLVQICQTYTYVKQESKSQIKGALKQHKNTYLLCPLINSKKNSDLLRICWQNWKFKAAEIQLDLIKDSESWISDIKREMDLKKIILIEYTNTIKNFAINLTTS